MWWGYAKPLCLGCLLSEKGLPRITWRSFCLAEMRVLCDFSHSVCLHFIMFLQPQPPSCVGCAVETVGRAIMSNVSIDFNSRSGCRERNLFFDQISYLSSPSTPLILSIKLMAFWRFCYKAYFLSITCWHKMMKYCFDIFSNLPFINERSDVQESDALDTHNSIYLHFNAVFQLYHGSL